MTTPSFQQWRITSSRGQGLNPQDIQSRMLWALAAYVSNTNPDGTART